MQREMFHLLLVDDEEEVLSLIRHTMDWEELGFEVMGTARNGVEALEECEEARPDVVMTDIKMPYMDGLTLSRELKKRYPKIRILIFSGFDEFEYAKEAIKIEAAEYLLKPIDPVELKEVFSRLYDSLLAERDERRNLTKLQEYYLQSLPKLREDFLLSLLEGSVQKESLPEYLELYQLSLPGPYFAAGLVHVSRSGLPDERSSLLLTVSVKEVFSEQLSREWEEGAYVLGRLGEIYLLLTLPSPGEATVLTDHLDRLAKEASRLCGATVTVGLGRAYQGLLDLSRSLKEAREALSYRAIYGNGRAISIAECSASFEGDEEWENRTVEGLLGAIRMGEEEEMKGRIKDLLSFFSSRGFSLERYRIFMMRFLAEVARLANANQLSMEQLFGGEDFYERIFQGEGPGDLSDWLLPAILRLGESLGATRRRATTSFVTRAESYVAEHYADTGLSVDTVSRKLGISATYFSTVFKRETGTTFIAYLTDYRLEEAKRLLLTTAELSYEIATKVGYSDANYFSYAFKKKYGSSPTRFRREGGRVKNG